MKTEKELLDFLGRQGIDLNAFQEKVPDNADEYIHERAQRVRKIRKDLRAMSDKGRDSETLSEEAVYQLLMDRGFGNVPITTSYSEEGDYIKEDVISESSNAHHPCYESKYRSDTGEVWNISVTGRNITAYPLSFNLNSSLEVPLILSESNMLTSYDLSSKTFYKSLPKESVFIVKQVDLIDRETLNSMTAEEMGR